MYIRLVQFGVPLDHPLFWVGQRGAPILIRLPCFKVFFKEKIFCLLPVTGQGGSGARIGGRHNREGVEKLLCRRLTSSSASRASRS
jgi:hypothetical protein